MATSKTSATGTERKKMTASELQSWYDMNFAKVQQLERFEEASEAIKQMRDVTKSSTRSISSFSKEKLRSYLSNIGGNESNLRDLSWYLYYRSHVYRRIINFMATMFCLDCREIHPKYDLLKNMDSKKMLKSYKETIDWMDLLDVKGQMYAPLVSCFVQDVFYGIHITDETGTFILPIPAQYARISGRYMTGDLAFAMDATYLKSHQELIEYLPDPLEKIWNDYNSTNNKWQFVPDEYAFALKWGIEDLQSITPIFISLFNPLINLLDLEDIQAVAQEQEIYKMLWYEMETISGSKDVDDWKIDPTIAAQYMNKLINDALPPYISAAIVPGKLNEISFDSDQASDVTRVAKGTEAVLNTAGGSEILNGATINNTYAFKMACIQNTNFAISSLLPQLNGWTNRKLSYLCTNPATVNYFHVSPYTKDDFKENLLKLGQNGFAVRLAIGTLCGFSENATLSLLHFENEVLGMQNLMIPLSTSYTISGSSGEVGQGRPKEESVGDLSDSGERNRSNSENV